MLRNVMSANEFAEQVAVINRDMERLSRPWKRSFKVFMALAILVLPVFISSIAVPLALGALGADDASLGLVAMPVGVLPLVLGMVVCLIRMLQTSESSDKKLSAIVEKQAERWESRGIEWFFSYNTYQLTAIGQKRECVDGRVRLSFSLSLSLSLHRIPLQKLLRAASLRVNRLL